MLILEVSRESYGKDDLNNTMTVSELINELSNYNQEQKIIVSHDNGYTYGSVRKENFREETLQFKALYALMNLIHMYITNKCNISENNIDITLDENEYDNKYYTIALENISTTSRVNLDLFLDTLEKTLNDACPVSIATLDDTDSYSQHIIRVDSENESKLKLLLEYLLLAEGVFLS